MFLRATNARSVSAAQIALSVKTLCLEHLFRPLFARPNVKVHEGEFFAVYFNSITAELDS